MIIFGNASTSETNFEVTQMAIALKRAPEMPKDAPMYTDQVIACGYPSCWVE